MNKAEDFSAAQEKRPAKFHIVRIFTYIAVATLYALVNFHKLCPTQVSQEMAKTYNVTKQELEIFSAIYFYPYALTQPFAGLFADLFDPAKVLAIFGTIAAAGSILCGFSTTLTLGIVGRVFVGLGCGPTYVSSIRIMTYWFKSQHIPILLGILVAISCLGGIVAATPLALFSARFGWRTAFYCIGGTGAGLSLLIGIFGRGKPEKLGFEPVNEAAQESDTTKFSERLRSLFVNIKEVVVYKYFWIIVIYNVTFSCPYLNVSAYWNGPFMTDVYNFTPIVIGNILIAHSAGLLFGSLTIPYVSHLLKTKKWVMFFGSALITGILVLLFFNGNHLHKIGLAVILFCFSMWSLTLTSINYPLLAEYYGSNVSGSAIGFANFFLFAFVAVYQHVSAAIIPLYGSSQTESGVAQYTWKGYKMGLWLFGLVSTSVATIMSLFIKDDNSTCICKKQDQRSHNDDLLQE